MEDYVGVKFVHALAEKTSHQKIVFALKVSLRFNCSLTQQYPAYMDRLLRVAGWRGVRHSLLLTFNREGTFNTQLQFIIWI